MENNEVIKINGIDLKDRLIICCDCGDEFVFSSSEQKYYYSKFLSIPRRCERCRMISKLRHLPLAYELNNSENE